MYTKGNKKDHIIYAPVSGKVLSLTKSESEDFKKGRVGKGVCIMPDTNEFRSVLNTYVSVLYPEGYAFSQVLKKQNITVWVHIGQKTDEIDSEVPAFKTYVAPYQSLKVNDLIVEADFNLIKKHKKNILSSVVVAKETLPYYQVEILTRGFVKAGDPLMKLIPIN